MKFADSPGYSGQLALFLLSEEDPVHSIASSNLASSPSVIMRSANAFAGRSGIKTPAVSGVEMPATTEARVAVVEDDERLREALAFQLSTAGFQVVTYSSSDELLASKDVNNFDCVVAAILLPRKNGLQLQAQLREMGNFVSIVLITEHNDLSIAVQAMRAGAVDVLERPVVDEALLNGIERGVRRSRAGRADRAQHLDLERRFRSLPPRQREVFTLITAGLANKQVGAQLGISERTVKVHRERLRRKMGADSLAELSHMAGLLQIPSMAISARPD